MSEATLKQLRSLVAVDKHGSLAAAAQALHITAPAVGQQLRLLEKAVGTPLVNRTPRGLKLTDAGVEVVETAGRIEHELHSCWEHVDLISAGKLGTVTLGAVSTAKYFAPGILASFWRTHPDIAVTLSVGNRRETISAIEEEAVDIAIMGRPPQELELDTFVIGPHPHVVIASPNHRLAGVRDISLDSVCDEVFLTREVGSGTRNLTDWLFTSAGRTATIGMEIYSNETIKQAAMAELGVALLSAHTVAAEIAEGRLVALDVVGTPVMRQWHAVRRSSGHLSPAGQALWEFLDHEAERHLPKVATR